MASIPKLQHIAQEIANIAISSTTPRTDLLYIGKCVEHQLKKREKELCDTRTRISRITDTASPQSHRDEQD